MQSLCHLDPDCVQWNFYQEPVRLNSQVLEKQPPKMRKVRKQYFCPIKWGPGSPSACEFLRTVFGHGLFEGGWTGRKGAEDMCGGGKERFDEAS